MKKAAKIMLITLIFSLLFGINSVVNAQQTKIYTDNASLAQDFRDETIYFVITTRFYDGDKSNNVYCWDGTAINEGDEPWRGDFKGLIDKLDYIKALGFTTVWITPVVKNSSGYDYHGYHAINFKEVDKRYESEDCTYQDLIDAVHERGMKIVQDVVFNHTGNFGEENLYKIFVKNENADLSSIEDCMTVNPDYLPWNYFTLTPEEQYHMRLDLMKNLDGEEKDKNNIYHHNGDFNWDDYTCQISQIAGDCVDLNTENPRVYKYLVDAYGQYIKMGVDAFRVDTVRHISRLSLNKGFISQLNDIYNSVHGTTGEGNFYMFGEVCTRYTQIWYREVPALSTPFYTWKESREYPWIDDENDPEAYITNMASAEQHYMDNDKDDISSQPVSDNALLNGNEYHETDYSMASGLSVIDFPMHWNFKTAKSAFNLAVNTDKYYNDATYNVVYVDSHDYAPDGAPEDKRFSGSQSTWAENLDLMFTFRGIPCIYYGSEVEFQKGKTIDKGYQISLADSGRAYFGDNIEGTIDTVDFAKYTNATGKMAETLNHPLSLHIQRLNRIRAAIPALRKGQYSTNDITTSGMAFKRRYTDSTTDSFALVAISGDATFKNIPNGRYTDAITGKVINVTNGTLTASCSEKADMRVYVLDTELTKAPGMIAGQSMYLSGGKDVVVQENPVKSISLDKTEATVELGESLKLKASIMPFNATGKTLTWKSSDESVALVSNGKITPRKAGTTTIIVSTQNGLSARAIITVTATGVQVEDIILDKTQAEMAIGDKISVTADISPADAANKTITWTSSNSDIASVNDGEITAKSLGTAVITATSVNGMEASVMITVKSKAVTGDVMYFEKPDDWSKSINCYIWSDTYKSSWPGVRMESYTDGVYVINYPEGETGLNVIFNDGSNQTADLKASANGYYNKDGLVKVDTDEKIEVTKVSADKETVELNIGDSISLTASVSPENASVKNIVWSSSNKEVADVEKSGIVSAKNSGSAIIYATANNGVRAEIKVVVKGNEEPLPGDKNRVFIYSFDSDAQENGILTGGKVKFTVMAESTSGGELEYRFWYNDGEKEEVLKDYSNTNTVEVIFDKVGKYNIYVSVKDADENTAKAVISGFDVHNEVVELPGEEDTTEDTTINQSPLKVTKFSVSKKSGSVKVGTSLKLTAKAAGGSENYKYRFAYKYKNKTVYICKYQTASSISWKPVHSGTYNLYVYIKDGNGNQAKKAISKYKVKPKTIKVSYFKSAIKSGKAVKGNTVKLSALAKGGYGKLKYKFVYRINGKNSTIKNYSSSKTVKWKIKKSGTYKLYVYVKDSDGKVVVKTINKYIVK
ncbi:MAG: starch-binding protein [Lachnospiraceae bacterium]|nr:starch-binding protein [Lachnospiraceae bacterium]